MGLMDWLFGPVTEYPETSQMQEGIFTGGGSYDPDANLTAAQGGSPYFRALTQGNRDLQPITQERAQEIAFWLYDTNPMAKRVLETTRDFVVGEGVMVHATEQDEELQKAIGAVIGRHWQDSVNQWDLKLYSKILELGLYGEQCWPVFVNPVDGHVRLGYIDPGAIGQVITDPENAELIVAIALKSSDGTAQGRRYKVVGMDERPGSPSFGRLVGADTDAQGQITETYQDRGPGGDLIGEPRPYDGSCCFFAINKVSNAKRGRSDLLALADWIDAYDQYLFNEVDRAVLLKSFVWWFKWTGLNDQQVTAKSREMAAPKPGAAMHSNEKMDMQAVTPDLKSQDAQIGADLILSYIATGAGLPKTWLSGTMDVNRATASELAEPAFKKLTSRQKYVTYMLQHVIAFVLDQAELHSALPKREGARPQPWAFTVAMPEMRGKDLSQAATALNQATQALATAMADGVIDVQAAQEVMVTLLTQFGVALDLEAMRERIEQEETEKAEQQALSPYVVGVGQNGNGNGNGLA